MYKYSKPTKEQDIGFFLMSLFFVIGFWFVFSVLGVAHADTLINGYTVDQYVDAIGKTENSKKFPYGIKSIKCHGESECRQICRNSVVNANKRWIKAGKPEDFVTFMGRRYSPPDINPNWVRLVKHFLKKDKT